LSRDFLPTPSSHLIFGDTLANSPLPLECHILSEWPLTIIIYWWRCKINFKLKSFVLDLFQNRGVQGWINIKSNYFKEKKKKSVNLKKSNKTCLMKQKRISNQEFLIKECCQLKVFNQKNEKNFHEKKLEKWNCDLPPNLT